ncbi:hypothetical protein GA0070609_4304 [Micromonospora echinaurantiaca]|uniref:Uncharacterized protein n=1 Tax=Micromonospora echinaurantiaca TaxID=47857 RepID=A0A1C5JC45_9ACTN|nr:hypothetical protein GA0070609_4304 [Micromonospora echinaurantiaca]
MPAMPAGRFPLLDPPAGRVPMPVPTIGWRAV